MLIAAREGPIDVDEVVVFEMRTHNKKHEELTNRIIYRNKRNILSPRQMDLQYVEVISLPVGSPRSCPS